MTAVLVDTDVFSYVFKGDDRGLPYQAHLDGKIACLSFMTVAELYRWAALRMWGPNRIELLRRRLAAFLILHPDDETCRNWAALMTVKGRTTSVTDAWVAATALRHQLPLVTHNRADFDGLPGLVVVSES